ncbi:hypothetical protein AUJ66_01050 [Candidatus Desantisbacteria bacterium CG1_02_38_46]|nr:MAG: hypothetical protein AUJ66_01050 [Candidatus Desantisbacteria bacterium CG1_02_38_46]
MINSLKDLSIVQIMLRAKENKIVVPAFNIAYLPMAEPVAMALIRTRAFGIVEVARPDYEKFGAKSLEAVAAEYRKYEDRDFMRLHEDHTPVIDEEGRKVDWKSLIRKALKLNFDSVMIDGSRLSLEENIEVTKEVVKMAHINGVPVEAELGAVLGHEKGPIPPYEELFKSGKGFTDPDEARRFVKETGVDWLSVAVGNIHGAISGAAKDQKKLEARLNIEHLHKLAELTDIPLVLHGGSGVNQQSVLAGIQNGICKINVGTEIRQAYENALKEKPGDIKFAQDAVQEKTIFLITEYYRIVHSADSLL